MLNSVRPVFSIRHFQIAVIMFGGLVFVWTSSVLAQPDSFDKNALAMRDSIQFRTGAKMFGTIKSEGVDDDGRKFVVFETDDQTVMKLDVSRLLSKPPKYVEKIDRAYNEMLEAMPDTAEAHRDAYKWCEDQSGGRTRFRDQIKFHCERVMELDPNDTSVKHRLGLEYIEEEDRWVPEELYYKSIGYERKGTSWAPILSQDAEKRDDLARKYEAERRTAYRKWKNNAKRMSPRQQQAELFRFCDEHSVPFLFEDAKKLDPANREDARIQMMFVEAFGKVPSYSAMEALIYFSVQGQSQIADRALDLLQQEQYNTDAAASRIAGQYFSANSNPILQRAAFVVGELGSENSILPLIGVLVTEHVVKPAEHPNRMKSAFSNNGVQSFSAGGDSKPTKVKIPNDAVVNALKKITGQDYQFSDSRWKHWYIENHTVHDGTLRPSRQ